MKLGIFGSRSLTDDRVRLIIHEFIKKIKASEIITAQEPQGVCEVAQRCAKDLAIPLKVHFLNFKYLRGAFDHRSRDIINDSDFVLIIHDGLSKGTANEYTLIKKMNKKHHYEILEILNVSKNEGWNIKDNWNDVKTNDDMGEEVNEL